MRDQIYNQKQTQVEDFKFNQSVAEVFDDMVERSVPFYHQIHKIIEDILDHYYVDGSLIYDLGCSTGTTMEVISQHLQDREYSMIGCDNSQDMLDKCSEKLTTSQVKKFKLECRDIADINFRPASMMIMNYTLQFIATEKRQPLVSKIFEALEPNGVFLLSEKIVSTDQQINKLLTDLYYDFKRDNGYSELEISQKREALENILVPLPADQQLELMKNAGFKKVETIFRWYNFACFIGIK